jgi:hypothetical protein
MIEQIQTLLNVPADGVWGPKSQAALNREIGLTVNANRTIEDIQLLLGVAADGRWGTKSQAALNKALGKADSFECKASSFADPADVRAFNRCKTTGKSDLQCFAVGDNGIGQFGKITAQDKVPMIAVHGGEMKAKWGSIPAAAHRPVEVTVRGKTIQATVEDRISAPGRIDLNPACAKMLGLNPPFVVPCKWRWL